ncbi:Kelch domain-containing protein 10 homolog [Gryllus bimaculatus]|nr:Kelch domain-containing protein 10 homolog [Gryllus bimaculatus]
MSAKDSGVQLYAFRPFVFVKRHPKTQTPSKSPLSRSGHRIACDEGNMYSFGGYNPYIPEDEELGEEVHDWQASEPLFKELWKYNFCTSNWTKLLCADDMPNELASNAVILKGTTMMVYGGTGVPFGTTCSNQLYVCNLNEKIKMNAIQASGELPPKQYGQALVLDGGFLYTVGGTTGYEYSADIHRLNLKTGQWEEVHVCRGGRGEPDGRYRHELAFDGSRIFVMGGGTATDVYGFEKIPAFNLSTGQWETLVTSGDPSLSPPGVPAARRCHGCVQLPSDGIQHSAVFISGGYDGSNIFDDLWKLDLNTLQWQHLSHCKLPRAVYFHSTALTPAGQLFSFGGIADMGNGEFDRTAEVHSTWVCIPKLSEMCWEALVHYNQFIHNVPSANLLNCGIPAKFLSRIG